MDLKPLIPLPIVVDTNLPDLALGELLRDKIMPHLPEVKSIDLTLLPPVLSSCISDCKITQLGTHETIFGVAGWIKGNPFLYLRLHTGRELYCPNLNHTHTDRHTCPWGTPTTPSRTLTSKDIIASLKEDKRRFPLCPIVPEATLSAATTPKQWLKDALPISNSWTGFNLDRNALIASLPKAIKLAKEAGVEVKLHQISSIFFPSPPSPTCLLELPLIELKVTGNRFKNCQIFLSQDSYFCPMESVLVTMKLTPADIQYLRKSNIGLATTFYEGPLKKSDKMPCSNQFLVDFTGLTIHSIPITHLPLLFSLC